MIRQLASSHEKKECSLRRLGGEDRAKLQLLLSKVCLPKDFEEDPDELNSSPISAPMGHVSVKKNMSPQKGEKCALSCLLSKDILQEYVNQDKEVFPPKKETAVVPYKKDTDTKLSSHSTAVPLHDSFNFGEIDMMQEMAKYMGERHLEKPKKKQGKPAAATDAAPPPPAKKAKCLKSADPRTPPVKRNGKVYEGIPADGRRKVLWPQGCAKCKNKPGCANSCWWYRNKAA